MPFEVELFFSPYCARCHAAREHVRAAISVLPANTVRYQERNVIEYLERAVELGVKATPAIAVSGKLLSTVRWEKKALHALFSSHFEKED